jgi:DNA-binding LacI/PurR family transcriptional regulator
MAGSIGSIGSGLYTQAITRKIRDSEGKVEANVTDLRMKTKPPTSSDAVQIPKKRTSLKDLATYLGVSQTTISFVLNDAPLAKNLTAETRRRVREAARKFNYRPSYFALNLHKTGSDSVGVIVPEHSEGYFTVVMEGVERYLLQKHFLYFTACHYGKQKLVKEYSELLMNRGAEGLLLLNTNADFDTPLPVVTISGHMEKEGVTNITLDHRSAARLAIRHLYDLGHRKIAFMKGPSSIIDSEFRWDAMMQVASELGVEPTPERTVQVNIGGWTPRIGYEPTQRLLAATRDFTALICFNDTSAIGAIRVLHEAGMRVPNDVSVVGFDDIVSAEFHVPSLTTIRQPLKHMGKLAASILLDRIANPVAEYAPNIPVKPALIVRESTAQVNPCTP